MPGLVITDPLRFVGALREAARSQLPDWHFGCKPVRYFDPVHDLKFLTNRTQTELAPFFCKDFRYAYQQEIRAAWLPPDPRNVRGDLDHIYVTLGNLEDYCELIEL